MILVLFDHFYKWENLEKKIKWIQYLRVSEIGRMIIRINKLM